MADDFRPTAPLEHLRQRAQVLARLRAFMAERGVWEATVPCLGRAGVTDVHLDALTLEAAGATHYLQTSPEFFLKRLLAAGSGAVYYLGPAFRKDERGRQHRFEFTMLEWYRPGLSYTELAAEVGELVAMLAPGAVVATHTYGELFEAAVGIDPHTATLESLQQLARTRLHFTSPLAAPSDYLDLLFSHLVQPELLAPTLVLDYPACQCALARLTRNSAGAPVAERFELYWRGLELANGYGELCDPVEQRARFERDRRERQQRGLPDIQADTNFLAALEAGLPDCSGVALGVERLMMALWELSDISQVMAFADG